MSTYDDSSLFLYPSGYKASVLFAQKPMDANGQLAFTRSNDTATRVGPDGLIEKVRTNLVLQSQTFDNASWTKDASSITANTIAAPDGTLTAETLTADGTSASHGIRQTGTATLTNGIVYSTSIYAKKGTNNFIQIVGSTSPYVTFNVFANFDLNNGVVGTVGSSVTATIQDAGNGWYRCTMIAAAAATSSTNSFIVQIVSSASAARGESNSLATSVFLWGAQLETSDFGPTPYIPTTTAAVSVGPVANVPRLDYLNNSCPRLLLEPQRTNIQLNSEDFSQSNWSKTNSAIVTNQVASPGGYVNADKLNETAVNSIHQLESTRSVSSSTVYTMSAFAKKAERSWVRIYEDTTSNSAYFNLESGTVGTIGGPTAVAKIENYGNGWYRCSVTYTETGTSGRYRITTAKQDNEASYLGVANNGIYVWGAQYEAGAYATSYIPTLGAAVTRGADACSKTGITSLIGQTEGTLYYEFSVPVNENVTRSIGVNDGTISNRVNISTFATSLFVRVDSGGVNQVNSSATIVPTAMNKVAFRYKANDFVAYVNGVKVITDTSGSTFSGTTLSSFSFIQPDSTSPFNGVVKQILFFKTGLSDSDLAALTA